MAAVDDAQSQEPPASPTADELKTSMVTGSADPGGRVAVCFRLMTVVWRQ